MCWLYLIFAIIFETIGTTTLKMSNGFSILLPSIGTIISYILCFVLFSYALKTIDMSIAYAIWGSFGILIISAIGMIFFHETVSLIKIVSIILIIIGTIGLKLAS